MDADVTCLLRVQSNGQDGSGLGSIAQGTDADGVKQEASSCQHFHRE